MPYSVQKRGDKWVTINTDTGSIKGTHSSKEAAESQMRLLYGIEGGMKPRSAKRRGK